MDAEPFWKMIISYIMRLKPDKNNPKKVFVEQGKRKNCGDGFVRQLKQSHLVIKGGIFSCQN